tara:strand:+ start:21656 stop:21778 length:123 start_codon:yes stop_codon:yes gene_type:complete
VISLVDILTKEEKLAKMQALLALKNAPKKRGRPKKIEEEE